MAITGSPMTRAEERPREAAGRDRSVRTRSTARSVTGSRPTMSAGSSRSAASSVTVISPPSAAVSTTWLLVRM
jgi:hypothetical protein